MVCKECAQEMELQIKLEEEREVGNFTDYVEAYFKLTTSYEQKGVRELHHDFNKQTYNRQTTSHQDSFLMSISNHINDLAPTIDFKFNRKKQDKSLNNHHLTLHISGKTKHNSSDSRYAALKWYCINFQWVFGMQLIGSGGRESTKLLGMLNLPWNGFEKKTFTKIEAHAGMAERLVRDLEIEEALREEIKHTLEHNNQLYGEKCSPSDKDKNNNKVKLTVTEDMGWQKISSGRRYDSSSGHAFIIGARRKGIIGMVLYSKACPKCDAA